MKILQIISLISCILICGNNLAGTTCTTCSGMCGEGTDGYCCAGYMCNCNDPINGVGWWEINLSQTC
jgi:hypothetical protein